MLGGKTRGEDHKQTNKQREIVLSMQQFAKLCEGDEALRQSTMVAGPSLRWRGVTSRTCVCVSGLPSSESTITLGYEDYRGAADHASPRVSFGFGRSGV